MGKRARLSRIKALRCYTIEEASDVAGVSGRTIRNWAKNGLQLLDSTRPVLIRGDDLRDYIKAQRDGRKIKTGLDEFYCCRCRRARKAAGGFADCTIMGARVTLTVLCANCETVIVKPVAKARIPEIARTLDLTITRPQTTFIVVDTRPPVFPLYATIVLWAFAPAKLQQKGGQNGQATK